MFLFGWLQSLFAGLITWFAQYFTKKIALTAAVLTMFLSLFAIFTASMMGAINAVLLYQPPAFIAFGLSLLPYNTEECIGLIVGAEVTSAIYRFHKEVLSIKYKTLLM